ncbi:hypothetical protein HZB74_04050 [Candidatus Saccharibacteria bacterium]|nr:hypothetical protein [Candidatus Saccharibacteria bacterium]
MEEDPSKNPPEGGKALSSLYVSDITDTEIHPDVLGKDYKNDPAFLDLVGSVRDRDIDAMSGALDNSVFAILQELETSYQEIDLPREAVLAVEFLHQTVESSVVSNEGGATMELLYDLATKDGEMFEAALVYPASYKVDQEKYLRILENITNAVELIAILEMLDEQQKDVRETLYDRLSGVIVDMRDSGLAEIIERRFSGEM